MSAPWTKEQVERLGKVEGWFDLRILGFYAKIDAAQRPLVTGHLAEIGVHHGRSFLPLALMARGGGTECAVAIDLFGPNEGRSGQGDRDILFANAKALGVNDGNIWLISGDSREMTRSDLLGPSNPYRFFSVDGDHSARGTFHDLMIAHDALHPEFGVLVVDDVWSPQWPSVQEGFARWMGMGLPVFGVAHVYGRTILTTDERFARRLQIDFLRDPALPRPVRESTWYGRPFYSYV